MCDVEMIGINKPNCKTCNILLYQNKKSELCNSYINTNYCKKCYNSNRKNAKKYVEQHKKDYKLSDEIKQRVAELYSQGNKVYNIYNKYEEFGLPKFDCSKNTLYL